MYWPGRNGADRPGEDVVEHQGRDGELGEEAAHRLLDHAVDAAADEERAAFDVDHAHAAAEDHHGQDEPRRRRADGPLDDPADVIGRARQVAQDDRRRPPVGDEREHHAADDDHFDRASQRMCGTGGSRNARRGTGRIAGHQTRCLTALVNRRFLVGAATEGPFVLPAVRSATNVRRPAKRVPGSD